MILPDLGASLVERQSASTPQYKNISNASNLLAIHGTFCGIAVLCVLLRLYVRMFMLKSVGADDYTMIGAAVGSVIDLV